MAKITFTRDCDYIHASRAMTAFKAGWSGTVKRDIQKWAIENGHGFEPAGSVANNDILSDGSAALLDSDAPTSD